MTVVINEVHYDPPGGDAPGVFTELWGPPGMALDGFRLQGINQAGTLYRTVPLTGAAIPDDGYLVVATADASGPLVGVRDVIGDVDWQNGPGDAVRLVDPHDRVIDAVQYGETTNGVIYGEGDPAPVTAGNSDASISRDANHTDTDDNATDFTVGPATPGY